MGTQKVKTSLLRQKRILLTNLKPSGFDFTCIQSMPSYLRKRESLIFWAVVTASPCRRYTKPLIEHNTTLKKTAFESFQALGEIHNADAQ